MQRATQMPFFLGFGARRLAAVRACASSCSTNNADAPLNLWLDWQLRRARARALLTGDAGLVNQDQQGLNEDPGPQRREIEVGQWRN